MILDGLPDLRADRAKDHRKLQGENVIREHLNAGNHVRGRLPACILEVAQVQIEDHELERLGHVSPLVARLPLPPKSATAGSLQPPGALEVRAGPLPLPAWGIRLLATTLVRRPHYSGRGPSVQEGISPRGVPCLPAPATTSESLIHRYSNRRRRGPSAWKGAGFTDLLVVPSPAPLSFFFS